MSNLVDFTAEAEALREQLVAWRRDFHMYPELGLQEHRSAGLIADRLREYTRESDLIARLGGDEFVLITPDLDQLDSLETLAHRVLNYLSKEYRLRGLDQPITLSASVGIAVAPRDGSTRDALLGHADAAMYLAKGRGGESLHGRQTAGGTRRCRRMGRDWRPLPGQVGNTRHHRQSTERNAPSAGRQCRAHENRGA